MKIKDINVMRPSAERPALKPRAEDIARLAGVSQSAVSRALSNSPGVSAKTRTRIREIAEQMHYSPNALASGLITQKSGLIGIVLSDLSNPFFNAILDEFLPILKRNGRQALMLQAESDEEMHEAALDLGRYRVDGCFVVCPHLSKPMAEKYSRQGSTVLMFTSQVPGLISASSVSVDNYAAGQMVADHLVSRGHTSLAYLQGIRGTKTDVDRHDGFTDRLKHHGINEIIKERGNYTYAGATGAARKLLSRKDRPTAIFCGNDMMAMAAKDTAQLEFSLRVPQDLALVGFDDAPHSSWPIYSLTTVRQPVIAMLNKGMSLMAKHWDEDFTGPEDVVMEAELVIRNSS